MLQQFILEMPKAEIHVHLEGAIQPETMLSLAQRNQMQDRLPSNNIDDLYQWFTFTGFPHFAEIYLTIQDLIRTPDDFAFVAERCGADMAAQNIRYREVTVTPFTHIEYQDKGLTIDDVLDGLERGRQAAKANYGVEIRWVFDCYRNLSFPDNNERFDPHPADRTLEFAIAGKEKGVIGYGLGGFEVGAPPQPFAPMFAEAKKAGLMSVPHAGETMGPSSVWGSVNELQADRLGHGVRAIEDPKLLQLLQERQIPLEVNIVSNKCLHIYRSIAEHPFPHLDRMGLHVTVNSDDPPLFNTTLCREYELLNEAFGYDKANIMRIARNAFTAVGAETAVKQTLLAEFDTWAAQQNLEN